MKKPELDLTNPNTSTAILLEKAKDLKWQVRIHVMSNPNTPPAALAVALRSDRSEKVRLAAAKNPSTSPEELANVVSKSVGKELDSVSVRVAAFRNPNMPVNYLRLMSKSGETIFQEAVLTNPSTPPDVLVQYASHTDHTVRQWVASNTGTPEHVLVVLSKDKHAMVRLAVVENPSTSLELVDLMARKDKGGVKSIAIDTLRARMDEEDFDGKLKDAGDNDDDQDEEDPEVESKQPVAPKKEMVYIPDIGFLEKDSITNVRYIRSYANPKAYGIVVESRTGTLGVVYTKDQKEANDLALNIVTTLGRQIDYITVSQDDL